MNKEKVLLDWYLEMGCSDVFDAQSQPSKKESCDISGIDDLQKLRHAVENQIDCELAHGAQNTVFADGNPDSDIMLIGEGPGASEDESGIPFCGRSGKLLDNIISSIGLNRSNTYITNVVFWRPPGNRSPTKDELDVCRPFVFRHINIIRPKLIILVGSTAFHALLNRKDTQMSEIRAQGFFEHNIGEHAYKMKAIFHPAYLLRQPQKKKVMWSDMQEISNFIATYKK